VYFCSVIKLFIKNEVSSLNLPKTNKMKPVLLFVFAVFAISGCTKNYPQVNQVYSAVYTVPADQWIRGTDQDGTVFYSYTATISELTQQIDLNGGVAVYLSFDDASATDPTYEALPEVIGNVAYGVVHTTGLVTVDLRRPDGSSMSDAIPVPTMLKIVLMDAQPLGN
jgi:hypothetical protein